MNLTQTGWQSPETRAKIQEALARKYEQGEPMIDKMPEPADQTKEKKAMQGVKYE